MCGSGNDIAFWLLAGGPMIAAVWLLVGIMGYATYRLVRGVPEREH